MDEKIVTEDGEYEVLVFTERGNVVVSMGPTRLEEGYSVNLSPEKSRALAQLLHAAHAELVQGEGNG